MGYFKGYEKKFGSYQERRRYEIEQREENRKKEYARLRAKKKLTKREKNILATLEKDYARLSEKDLGQHMVPVRDDHRTVRFIRLRNLYRQKWLELYGKDKLDKCRENYFKSLGCRPDGEVYWDYGI